MKRLAQREIELTTQLVRFSREGISSVETLQKAGEVGQADVLQAQVELEAASMLQAAAEQRQLAAWRELSALLGSMELSMQPLAGDVAMGAEVLDFGATLIEVQARSPEVAAAVVEIQALVTRWLAPESNQRRTSTSKASTTGKTTASAARRMAACR